jgi:1-phosphatidylinositol-4-phosphate 5-kinase
VYIELSEYQICPGEKVSILPSQKRLAVWRSTKGGLGDCVSGKPRRMSVDAGRASVGLEKPSDRMQIWGGGEGTDINSGTITPIKDGHELFTLHAHASNNPSQPLKAPKKSKRQGETICKGHKNYELMLNLQLGIR